MTEEYSSNASIRIWSGERLACKFQAVRANLFCNEGERGHENAE
jgi:hypothetical protein